MCFGGSKSKDPAPPAPAPPPAEPTASVAEAAPDRKSSADEKRTGRSALRIDRTSTAPVGGAGLNVPQ